MKKRSLLFTALFIALFVGCDSKDSLTTSSRIQNIQTFDGTAETIDFSSEEVSEEITVEPIPETTMHTMAEFSAKYRNPAYDTEDPVEAAREYVTELQDKPYVFNFEIKDAMILEPAVTHWTDNLRNCVHYEEETVMDVYGWTTDMIDRGIFTVVRVDYYANFDHTKTPTSFEGDCYMNVYLVQYEDTGTWQVYDRGYHKYNQGGKTDD